LRETADWLGASPLRAAIAAVLDDDASESAVRAARRAVRDLRAFADELETREGSKRSSPGRKHRASPAALGKGLGGSAFGLGDSPGLPKKSASLDRVMRSDLYSHSSSSLAGSSWGSNPDEDDDEDARYPRGSRDETRFSESDFRGTDDFVGGGGATGSRRSSTDSETRGFGAHGRRCESFGGSSGRVSADSAGAAEGAVAALAALSPRARARGLAAIRHPRKKLGAVTFDVRKALEKADGDWDFALGCAGRHAVLAREQIAILRTLLFPPAFEDGDRRSASDANVEAKAAAAGGTAGGTGALEVHSHSHSRDDARILAAAIAQLRSVAEGASVSHAPRLMDAVEAAAAALVSAAHACASRSPEPAVSPSTESTALGESSSVSWRARSRRLLRRLEKRADEYARSVEEMANTSRAFSPRFVFSDLCGGNAHAAIDKLRVLVLAARDAHVTAVRAVAAAESSFGSEALGGTFSKAEDVAEEGESSSSDEGESRGAAEGFAKGSCFSGGRFAVARGDQARHPRVTSSRAAILSDVRRDLSTAIASLETCERLACALGARPSERALRGAGVRVAKIAADVSAAAAQSDGEKASVPGCFLEDEHARTVAALAALKREVEALASDFHVVAPQVDLPSSRGKGIGKPNDENRFRFFFRSVSNLATDFAFPGRGGDSFAKRLRTTVASWFASSDRFSENALVGCATAVVAAYTAARLYRGFGEDQIER
jgi:hypothetical protein